MSKIDLSALTNFIKQKNNSSYVENGVLNIKSEFATKEDILREALPILREIRQSILDEATKDKGWIASETSSSNLLDYCEALITSEDKD